jgi:S1-C subfamily serine protease
MISAWVWSMVALGAMNQPSQGEIANVVGMKGLGGQEGTGVVISKQGQMALVLTAAHLLSEGDTSATATLFRQESMGRPLAKIAKAMLVHRHSEADLAFMRIDITGLNLTPARLAPARIRISATDVDIHSVGCDRGYPTDRTEVILGKRLLNRPGSGSAFFWQARDPSVPGRSGGPLWNADDQLIGICSGYQAGKGYYTHIDEIRASCHRFAPTWPVP